MTNAIPHPPRPGRSYKSRLFGLGACWRWIALLAMQPLAAAESMRALRQQVAERPRPLIFNNDGNEPVYLMKVPTAEELLRHRTTKLAGSHVGTIFYCTWGSGVGLFTHNTKVAEVFDTKEGYFSTNLTRDLLDAGIDPLNVMIEFGRKHRIEVFWSMRMNDVHDSNTNYVWGPLTFKSNRFKLRHPEYLFGTAEHPPKIGGWSGVDYGQAGVRDYVFRIIEEVCQNYAVDGIELDFNRYPVLFKSNAMGRQATNADRAGMTDLLRRVRVAADAAGANRGRPILITARVPDSVEYCRAIGLDLEHWLRNDLLDMMTIGGYFQLNPWEYSVALARKYGVKVYSSIDDARIRRLPANRAMRNSVLSRRGQAMNLWAAGVDGIYMFNAFDPNDPLWRELGDPKLLATLDKDYFASVRGRGYAAVTWYPNAKFQNVAFLNPDAPLPLRAGRKTTVSFYVGDDFTQAPIIPKTVLRLQFKNLPDESTSRFVGIELNGTLLPEGQLDQKLTSWLDLDKWIEFEVSPTLLKQGENIVSVILNPTGPTTAQWIDLLLTVRFPSAQK
ncbi:MAG: hypothetical protein HUU20_24105 [Pirellulales bacterium]|nr:hypothetical protein [Pirellulales bacterium]